MDLKEMLYHNGCYGKVMLFHAVNELRFSHFHTFFLAASSHCHYIFAIYKAQHDKLQHETHHHWIHLSLCRSGSVALFSVTSTYFCNFFLFRFTLFSQSDFAVLSLSFFSVSDLLLLLLGCCRRTEILNIAFSFTPTLFFDHMKS